MVRTRQPQGPARIDWGNPLTRGLKASWNFAQPNEILSGVPVVPGEAVFDVGYGGRGLTNYEYGTDCPILVSDSSTVLPTGPCTIVVYSKWLIGDSALISAGDPAESTSECHIFAPYFGRLYWRYGNGTGIDVAYSAGGDDVIAVTAGGDLGMQIWCNGSMLHSSASVITRTQTSAALGFGYPVFGRRNGERRYCVHIFHRQLSDAEMAIIGRNPWIVYAPQRRLWIQIGAAAGGTTTEATLSATVTASLLGSRAISVTRSAASATGAATTRAISTIKSATTTASSVLARAVAKIVSAATTTVATIANQVTSGAQTFYRELAAAATAGALALRQSNLTQSASAAASAAYTRWIWITKTATQAATATQTSIKVKLLALTTTALSAGATLTRRVNAERAAIAATGAIAVRAVGVYLTAVENAVAARLAVVSRVFSTSAGASAALTSLKVRLATLTASVGSAATLLRQTLAVRAASVTASATYLRAIDATLAATQPVVAVAFKSVNKALAATLSAVGALVRLLLSGTFWSADRTYVIAAAPRTYVIAAAPRTYVVTT